MRRCSQGKFKPHWVWVWIWEDFRIKPVRNCSEQMEGNMWFFVVSHEEIHHPSHS